MRMLSSVDHIYCHHHKPLLNDMLPSSSFLAQNYASIETISSCVHAPIFHRWRDMNEWWLLYAASGFCHRNRARFCSSAKENDRSPKNGGLFLLSVCFWSKNSNVGSHPVFCNVSPPLMHTLYQPFSSYNCGRDELPLPLLLLLVSLLVAWSLGQFKR